MHYTSPTYKRIAAGTHTVHTVVELETVGDGEAEYIEIGEDRLYSVKTSGSVFPEDEPSIGNFTAREIDLTFNVPDDIEIPQMARIRPFIYIENGSETSERIQKGEFFVDTREYNSDKTKIMIHGFDAALKLEEDLDSSSVEWPCPVGQLIFVICRSAGIRLTDKVVNKLYQLFYYRRVPLIPNATKREVMQWIAAMACGNFLIDDEGSLDFAPLNIVSGAEPETSYLVDESGNAITIGGDRIIV